MTISVRTKKRGFVMTGGGAKGLYEAGVIHAFHLTGMEFDIITGSSIGAMNSMFYAEYLFHKHQLTDAVLGDPIATIEALDERVNAYHHAWLQMPDKRIVDDSEQGPIGKLKNDLLRIRVDLPLITRLGWWWSDPDHASTPPPGVWPSLLKVLNQIVGRLGANELLRILKSKETSPASTVLRTYLARFGIERSLIPADQDHKLKDIFTKPISPLRQEHLLGDINSPDEPGTETFILVDPDRTLKDFEDEKIGVRVTRANYRTGRLEVSAYISLQQFAIFMKKQAWRLQAYGAEKIPLGSFRLQVPGNPNAINAGICSGRFPGVFAPYPIDYLYPENDPENILLYHILTDWLQSKEVESSLKHAASELNLSDKWDAMYANWQNSKDMRDFFPKKGDFYVDGGAIDNTPSNSAVDFAREQLEREGIGRREASLELFIIYLETEPKVEPEEIKDPALYQVINRTLAIQGAAKGSSDANTVQTINAYGQRSEDLAVVLKALMDSLKSITPELNQPQKRHLEQLLYTQAKQSRWDEVRGKGPEDILTRLEAWTNQMMDLKLPLEVNEIKIYPVEMPMGTLQFTERLGYRKENAIKMLTMGCYDTLWALRNNLESQGKYSLDAQDIKSLSLTRKWMGFDQWPSESSTQELVKKTWLCQREKCVYYSQFCAHGAKLVK